MAYNLTKFLENVGGRKLLILWQEPAGRWKLPQGPDFRQAWSRDSALV